MAMRGIQPPPLGSVKSILYARMFSMEQIREHETMSTIALIIAGALGVDQNRMGNIMKILESHRESIAYGNWSLEAKKKVQQRAASDADLLEKVKNL